MADDIQSAIAECSAARSKAAKPLVFSKEAIASLEERSDAQLQASLPQISGGWEKVKDEVLRACTLVGTVAKQIAEFQNPDATEITLEQAGLARSVAEKACRLRLAEKSKKPVAAVGVNEGLVCS